MPSSFSLLHSIARVGQRHCLYDDDFGGMWVMCIYAANSHIASTMNICNPSARRDHAVQLWFHWWSSDKIHRMCQPERNRMLLCTGSLLSFSKNGFSVFLHEGSVMLTSTSKPTLSPFPVEVCSIPLRDYMTTSIPIAWTFNQSSHIVSRYVWFHHGPTSFLAFIALFPLASACNLKLFLN